MSPSGYFQAVPAVVRAFAVLERLAIEPQGLTLAALSRALEVNPSSLLAILNTLTSRAYLRRESDSGRYRLGPGLIPLANAIEAPVVLEREFNLLASRLVEATGETTLLWTIDGTDTVLVGGHESPRSLRLVPRLGDRQLADTTTAGRVLLAAVSDPPSGLFAPWVAEIRSRGIATGADSTDPALEFIVAPVLGPDGRTIAALGIGGPADRFARDRILVRAIDLVREAAAELSTYLGCPDYRPYQTLGLSNPSATSLRPSGWSVSKGGLTVDELDHFLTGRHLTRIACVKPDGYPYTVPAWYEWDGEAFWIMPRAHAGWAQYLQLNPRVSMAIDEPDPPLRRVLVEGHAEVVEEACLDGRWRDIMVRAARRYLGVEADRYLELALSQPHWLFRIKPEQLRTWRGLASHPRYGHSSDIGAA